LGTGFSSGFFAIGFLRGGGFWAETAFLSGATFLVAAMLLAAEPVLPDDFEPPGRRLFAAALSRGFIRLLRVGVSPAR
jgi:hypothetical protein